MTETTQIMSPTLVPERAPNAVTPIENQIRSSFFFKQNTTPVYCQHGFEAKRSPEVFP